MACVASAARSTIEDTVRYITLDMSTSSSTHDLGPASFAQRQRQYFEQENGTRLPLKEGLGTLARPILGLALASRGMATLVLL